MKKMVFSSMLTLLIAILLVPKASLYYTFEKLLAQEHLFINDDPLTNRLIDITSAQATLTFDQTAIASLGSLRLAPWLFVNTFECSDVRFQGTFRQLFPDPVESVQLRYTLWNPLHITIKAQGGFGSMQGHFDLSTHHMVLVFAQDQALARYPLLLSKLRQSEEGLVYESTF